MVVALRRCSLILRMTAVPIALLWFWVWMAVVDGPGIPDPATGRVVPTANHGHDVYITVLQSHFLHWLIPLGAALGIAGHLVSRLADKLVANHRQ